MRVRARFSPRRARNAAGRVAREHEALHPLHPLHCCTCYTRQGELHENMKEAEQRQKERLTKVEASMKTYVGTAIQDALNSFEIPVSCPATRSWQ